MPDSVETRDATFRWKRELAIPASPRVPATSHLRPRSVTRAAARAAATRAAAHATAARTAATASAARSAAYSATLEQFAHSLAATQPRAVAVDSAERGIEGGALHRMFTCAQRQIGSAD